MTAFGAESSAAPGDAAAEYVAGSQADTERESAGLAGTLVDVLGPDGFALLRDDYRDVGWSDVLEEDIDLGELSWVPVAALRTVLPDFRPTRAEVAAWCADHGETDPHDARDQVAQHEADIAMKATPATVGMHLPPEFWERRGFLRHIRDAAWSRDESPSGVLLASLAILSSHVDPVTRVDTGIKSPLPMNLFVGLCSTSGVGKSSAVSAAERLLCVDPYTTDSGETPRVLGLGSGQGIAEAYMGTIPEIDPVTGKQVRVRKQVRHKVVLVCDEAGEMLATMSQRGSTLAATLRGAWSGNLRGQANATEESRREITAFSLGLVAGFQREVLARLLTEGEQENGTPQRFLYGSVADPYAPDIDAVPGDPGPLVVDLSALRGVRLSVPLMRSVRAASLARRRGQIDVPQLESQRPAMVARTAALLTILDGRAVVETEDWALAETLFSASLAVQRDAEEWAQEAESEKAEQRAATARAHAVATAAAVDGRDAALDRLGARIMKALPAAGEPVLWTGRTGLRKAKFKGTDRPLADAARDALLAAGSITFDGDKIARA